MKFPKESLDVFLPARFEDKSGCCRILNLLAFVKIFFESLGGSTIYSGLVLTEQIHSGGFS